MAKILAVQEQRFSHMEKLLEQHTEIMQRQDQHNEDRNQTMTNSLYQFKEEINATINEKMDDLRGETKAIEKDYDNRLKNLEKHQWIVYGGLALLVFIISEVIPNFGSLVGFLLKH